MSYTDQDRTLAFAGIYQAARQVHDLAAQGKRHDPYFEVSLNSLLITDPDNTLDVFGGELEKLRLGLETMVTQMLGSNRNLYITQYALGMVILAKKLLADSERLNRISEVMETARRQKTHFGELNQQVIETFSRAYKENISNLNPRIMIKGMPVYLQDEANAARIRALLLAGIRAAILWYQTGGTRWQLIWKRRVYLKTAQQLLNQLPSKPLFSPQ
ncbi:MAG TPA: lysogenization regulator HflD [Sulfurivirga caldicuralii]|nr:lysogenization regulator HflD [Sulfurivirga caldicuralii]